MGINQNNGLGGHGRRWKYGRALISTRRTTLVTGSSRWMRYEVRGAWDVFSLVPHCIKIILIQCGTRPKTSGTKVGIPPSPGALASQIYIYLFPTLDQTEVMPVARQRRLRFSLPHDREVALGVI